MYTADNYVLYVASLRRPVTTLQPSTNGTCGPATASTDSCQGTESFPAYSEHEATQPRKDYDSDDSVESWSDDDEIWDSDDDTVRKKRTSDDGMPFVFDDEADPEFVAEIEAAFPAHVCSKEERTEDYEEDIEADEETLDFIAKVNAALKREMEGEFEGDVESGDEDSDSNYAESDDEASDNEADQDESDDRSEDETEEHEVAHPSLAWGMRCTIL